MTAASMRVTPPVSSAPLPARTSAGLVLFALLATGCSLVVDSAREQCKTDLECTDRGPAFEGSVCLQSLCQESPAWACVNDTERLVDQRALLVPISIFQILTNEPVPDATIQLCNRADTECANPFNTVTTDALGAAVLNLQDNFTGYLSIAKTGVIEPTLLFPNLPIFDGEPLGPLPLLPPGGGGFLASQLGVTPVAGRGTVLMGVENCQAAGALGAVVSFQGDMSGARPFYSFNGLPSSSATSVDETGQTGVLNALPGFLGVQSTMDGRPVGQVSLLVRADTVSLVLIKPGYGPLEAF